MNKEEDESFKIFEPLPDYTFSQIETIWKSQHRNEAITETYSSLTNPLSIITETDIRNLYQFFYGEEFEWHPVPTEANNWDLERSQLSDSTNHSRPEHWKFKGKR